MHQLENYEYFAISFVALPHLIQNLQLECKKKNKKTYYKTSGSADLTQSTLAVILVLLHCRM